MGFARWRVHDGLLYRCFYHYRSAEMSFSQFFFSTTLVEGALASPRYCFCVSVWLLLVRNLDFSFVLGRHKTGAGGRSIRQVGRERALRCTRRISMGHNGRSNRRSPQVHWIRTRLHEPVRMEGVHIPPRGEPRAHWLCVQRFPQDQKSAQGMRQHPFVSNGGWIGSRAQRALCRSDVYRRWYCCRGLAFVVRQGFPSFLLLLFFVSILLWCVSKMILL